MQKIDFIQQLKKALQKELPGISAQLKMAHIHRKTVLKEYKIPNNAKIAAVLNLLYPSNGEWHTVLMKRVPFDPTKDKHSGQVSFPGGRQEKEDASLMHTALREAEEEIGIVADSVAILGKMTPLYIPVSNFLVHPYIGFLPTRPKFQPSKEEVAELIEVPLSTLLNTANTKTTSLDLVRGVRLSNVPYYDAKGHVVWGATAMMLSEFLEVVRRR